MDVLHEKNCIADSFRPAGPCLSDVAQRESFAFIVGDGAGFVDDDDVDGCCRLLRRWIELPEVERRRMRRQARATFERRYIAAAAAEDLLKNIQLLRAQ
jgi:glycosyltransferase involved in cell wall biosynthesis